MCSKVYRWPEDFIALDGDSLRVRPDFLPLFEQWGWTTLDAVLESPRCNVFRKVAERENGKIHLPSPEGAGETVAFMKRHRGRSITGWLRGLLTGESLEPPGLAEANAVGRCQQAGVPTMAVIAAGAKVRSVPWRVDSFFLSEEIPQGEPADRFWRNQIGPPSEQSAGERRRVLAALADTARVFHQANLFHRDFYWCHFFVRRRDGGEVVSHLIDLQRVKSSWMFRSRWLLKDLAQFLFSIPEGQVTAEEREFWFARYRDKDRLSLGDRIWYWMIETRARLYRWKEARG